MLAHLWLCVHVRVCVHVCVCVCPQLETYSDAAASTTQAHRDMEDELRSTQRKCRTLQQQLEASHASVRHPACVYVRVAMNALVDVLVSCVRPCAACLLLRLLRSSVRSRPTPS